MKRLLTFVLLLLTISVGKGYGETFWVGTVSDGGSVSASNVMGLDWSQSGSGVAPGGLQLAPDQIFLFRYQSQLAGLTGPTGDKVEFTGLNSAFEYTVVAQFSERVTSITPNPDNPNIVTAFFTTLDDGKFYIYAGAANAVVATGTGFDDGTLVAEGTINPDQISMFTNFGNGNGQGSFTLTGKVAYVNPVYLNPATITGIRVEGTTNLPPIDSLTTAFFVGGSDVNLPAYTVGPTDLVLKVDASSKFITAPPPPGPCRVTAGGVKDGLTVPCVLKANGLPDPKTCAETAFDTWGGQAGAQPGIDGNWTHHHVASAKQSFVFHSNSLFFIGCSDPGCCIPACANAEEHQIDFAGIGKFNNQKGYAPALPSGDLCFEVHLEDIGEPGPGGRWPSATAPCTHCPGTPIEPGDCMNCTDYYEIKIYDTAAHDAAGNCTGTLIYYNGAGSTNCNPGPPDNDPSLVGYFTRSGNVQMHPENN